MLLTYVRAILCAFCLPMHVGIHSLAGIYDESVGSKKALPGIVTNSRDTMHANASACVKNSARLPFTCLGKVKCFITCHNSRPCRLPTNRFA